MMKNGKPTLMGMTLASVGLLLAGSPAIGSPGSGAAAGPVKAIAEQWAAAYHQGDLEAIMRLYTDDAMLLPTGSEPVAGRAAVQEYFRKNLFATAPGSIRFFNYEFYGNDRATTEVSELEIRDPAGKVTLRGKQILVVLNRNGQWRIHRDIWTTN